LFAKVMNQSSSCSFAALRRVVALERFDESIPSKLRSPLRADQSEGGTGAASRVIGGAGVGGTAPAGAKLCGSAAGDAGAAEMPDLRGSRPEKSTSCVGDAVV
jgi:hypothetical protein